MVVNAITWALSAAMLTGVAWLYGAMNSVNPQKTPLARAVAAKLASAPASELDKVIRALTIDEFSAYFVGLRPPTQITRPAQAAAHARIADRWSRPWPFRRRNRALEVLAGIYRTEARLLR